MKSEYLTKSTINDKIARAAFSHITGLLTLGAINLQF
jgi:hypothetical protein